MTTMIVIASTGCDDESVVEVGQIDVGGSREIEVPASGTVGAPVPVHLNTFGDDCVSLERTDVEMTSDGAAITPYDRRTIPGDDAGCPQILLRFTHDVAVTFETAGQKTIVINGRKASRSTDVVQASFAITIQ